MTTTTSAIGELTATAMPPAEPIDLPASPDLGRRPSAGQGGVVEDVQQEAAASLTDVRMRSVCQDLKVLPCSDSKGEEKGPPDAGGDGAEVRWDAEDLQILRLCRNRAYYKVNNKRRQNIHASLSSFLLKEWLGHRPNSQFTARYLLAVYVDHFEGGHAKGSASEATKGQVSSGGAAPPRRTGSRSRRGPTPETPLAPPDEHLATLSSSPPNKPSRSTTTSTTTTTAGSGDKQWTEEMLANLVKCGQVAEAKLGESKAGPAAFSSILYEEWKKIYPNTVLNARNVKSRLSVYRKTVSELPPPSKRRKVTTLPAAAPSSSGEVAPDRPPPDSALINGNNAPGLEDSGRPRLKDSNADPCPGNLSAVENGHQGQLPADDGGKQAVLIPLLPGGDRACPKHWCHLFHDKDKEVMCTLTEQLLSIRRSLEPQYQGCGDIYSPRKPKGFSLRVVKEWKKYYPDSEENTKSMGYKLAKYDRGPDTDLDETGVKITSKGRIMWSQSMLNHLTETRKLAVSRAKSSANGCSVGSIWRREWFKLYPDLKVDWRTVISRYNYHFGGIDSVTEVGGSGEAVAEGSGNGHDDHKIDGEDDDEDEEGRPDEVDDDAVKVKGFRNWTGKDVQDLLETKAKMVERNPHLETGSAEFCSLLLKAFQKTHPNCMESTRSLYSKLQSIERAPPAPESQRSPRAAAKRRRSAVVDPEGHSIESSSKTPRTSVEKPDEEEENGFSTIEGFEDWTLEMIRNFIACMDMARRRYAKLKELHPNSQVKLVPLLLDEWRTIYPGSTESVKTFLVKIKHLKVQKEVIKKHLGRSGLLPKSSGADSRSQEAGGLPPRPDPPLKSSQDGGGDGDEDRSKTAFKWHKDMIQDVIESRKKAIEIRDRGLEKGQQKLSFHAIWEAEFRKVYPNSNFGSNNLSIHFWTWRKQQQKQRAQQQAQAQQGHGLGSASGASQGPCAEQGKVQSIKVTKFGGLSEKMQGFRAANNGAAAAAEVDDIKIRAAWTPKHNQVLRECLADLQEQQGDPDQKVAALVKMWRSKFPKSSIGDSELVRRIADRLEVRKVVGTTPTADDRPSSSGLLSSDSPSGPSPEGPVRWNKQAVMDIFEAHFRAAAKAADKTDPMVAKNLHDFFVRLHPHCRLSAPALMLKCLSLREDFISGKLDLTLPPDFAKKWQHDDVESSGTTPEPEPDPSCAISAETVSSRGHPSAVGPPKPPPSSPSPVLGQQQRRKKDLIFRTWTQEMIDNMLMTRKMAVAQKKRLQMGQGGQGAGEGGCSGSSQFSITDYWYREFIKLHPTYKCNKKNLWRKYKWYKSRITEVTTASGGHEGEGELDDDDDRGPQGGLGAVKAEAPVPIGVSKRPPPAIRKDMFQFIKICLEGDVLPVPSRVPPELLLAAISSGCPSKVGPSGPPAIPATTTSSAASSSGGLGSKSADKGGSGSSSCNRGGILLPGGATLVAVTPGIIQTGGKEPMSKGTLSTNLSKPGDSEVEKPQVTITVGGARTPSGTQHGWAIAAKDQNNRPVVNLTGDWHDGSSKEENAQQPSTITAILQTPDQSIIPLQIPVMSCVLQPGSGGAPAPTAEGHQASRPAGSSSRSWSSHICGMMASAGLTDNVQVMELLRLYEECWDPYVSALKGGHLAFFPHYLADVWRQRQQPECSSVPVDGRSLVNLAEECIREATGGAGWQLMVLKKNPCGFSVTEELIQSILTIFDEEQFRLLQEDLDDDKSLFLTSTKSSSRDDAASRAKVYKALCQRWKREHPGVRLTNRQLVSIHWMYDLDFRKNKAMDPSPETVCQLVDIWRTMEDDVSSSRHIRECPAELRSQKLKEIVPDEDNSDKSTITMERLQGWLAATYNLPGTTARKIKVAPRRPRLVAKNPRLFWSLQRVQDLMDCRDVAVRRFKCRPSKSKSKSRSILQMMCAHFKRLHPEGHNIRLPDAQILGKCIRVMRLAKNLASKVIKEEVRDWNQRSLAFIDSEEAVQVTVATKDKDDGCQDLKPQGKRGSTDEDDGWIAPSVEPSSGASSATSVAGPSFSLTTKSYSTPHYSSSTSSGSNPEPPLSIPPSLMKRPNLNFNRDSDVVEYIRQSQQNSRSKNVSTTWTSEVIEDLIRARTEARRRKRVWEAWATQEYGGIGVAYNNPNIHYQKVDEMFKEEWGKLRPDMANLSICTLVSYARKFDVLKKQLLQESGQVDETFSGPTRFGYRREAATAAALAAADDEEAASAGSRRRTTTPVFFPGSKIPKFDPEKLQALGTVSSELKELILSRQAAKERQEQEALQGRPRRTLISLWRQEWQGVHPDSALLKGDLLFKRLWTLERLGNNGANIRQALLASEPKPSQDWTEDPRRGLGDTLDDFDDDDFCRIRPRRSVFPEDELTFQDDGLTARTQPQVNTNNKRTTLHVGSTIPARFPQLSNGNRVLMRCDVPIPGSKTGRKRKLAVSFERDLFGQRHLNLEIPILEYVRGEVPVQHEEDDDDDEDDEDEGDLDPVSTTRFEPAYKAVMVAKRSSSLRSPWLEEDLSSDLTDKFRCRFCSKDFHNFNNYSHHLALHQTEDDWRLLSTGNDLGPLLSGVRIKEEKT